MSRHKPESTRFIGASETPQSGGSTAGAARWWVLLAVGVGTFMSALDGSVVNVILPLVSKSFHSTVASVEWIITVYLLVVSSRWGCWPWRSVVVLFLRTDLRTPVNLLTFRAQYSLLSV